MSVIAMDLSILGLPTNILLVLAFLFGVIIGSFLNVYIYRLHTGKSLAGHSHCLSCGVQLLWYDLFPLVSYLILRARCRHCGCHIPERYFLVELLTGVLFAATLSLTTSVFEVLVFWGIFSALVVILVYDINHQIIPDSLTIFIAAATVILLFISYLEGLPVSTIGWDLVAAALGSGFLLLLWVVSKGTWLGFGDVKLALPLGLLVGSQSVFSFMVMSFWIGAGISICLLLWQRLARGKNHLHLASGGLTMKSAVPFAPFMIMGALTILFTNINVLAFFTF